MVKNIALMLGAALLTVTSMGSMGCAKSYIPNTEVEDNAENREIVRVCEKYRRAVEERNIGMLMALASPRYFDNSGTTTGEDDYDRQGLEQVLRVRFATIKAMRYEFKYRSIFESQGLMYVEYTYTMSFQYEVDGQSHWANRTGDNRLELEKVGDGYLIVSGM